MTAHTAAVQVELRVQELLSTPEGRAATARHLALLEERNRLFEALKDAVRTGVDPFIDDAGRALVHGVPPVLPGVELPACETGPEDTTDVTSSTRRPRQAIEAIQGGNDE